MTAMASGSVLLWQNPQCFQSAHTLTCHQIISALQRPGATFWHRGAIRMAAVSVVRQQKSTMRSPALTLSCHQGI